MLGDLGQPQFTVSFPSRRLIFLVLETDRNSFSQLSENYIATTQSHLCDNTSERNIKQHLIQLVGNKRLTILYWLPEVKFAIFLKTFIVDPFDI